MLKILVIGSVRYIDLYMIRVIGEEGHEVLLYGNLSRGREKAVLCGRLVVGGLADGEGVRRVFRDLGSGAVAHFASYAIIAKSVEKLLFHFFGSGCYKAWLCRKGSAEWH